MPSGRSLERQANRQHRHIQLCGNALMESCCGLMQACNSRCVQDCVDQKPPVIVQRSPYGPEPDAVSVADHGEDGFRREERQRQAPCRR